ncbi:MAG: tetratricopeptide repeat protein [Anaerolineales bacterium]|nr:tetratricopeptide repeat protein [Anaerolineales bacterium]MCB8953358.1 tetratricopeptide repeat protein [Ardenticatenales bacterium]
MSGLRLQLLGEFRVTYDNAPINGFATDKVRALLAYLAVEADRTHTRGALATLLWSDWEESAALSNLRKTLFRLRQALADISPDADTPILAITRADVQFRADPNTVDLWQFTQWSRDDDPARWTAAAALYRGELLDGLALSGAPVFDEWLTIRREQLHQQALNVWARLADHHLAQGQMEQAQQDAARQLALEPWRESAHRQLMRAYAAAGQRAQALAQYAQCVAILAEELGVEPSEETKALAGSIDQDRSPASRLHHFPPALTAFVGRQQDVALLLSRLNHPQTRLITITGTGGMGKTRLTVEAATHWVAQSSTAEAYFVSLGAATTQQTLWQTLGAQLGVPSGKRGLTEADILAWLRSRSLLLVLDNYEQLLPDAQAISQILRHAPQTRLLVTSRLPLNLHGEWRLPLVGLPTPPPDSALEELIAYPSVQLLASAAQQAWPAFHVDANNAEAVGVICRLLAGMPLALEIAASWLQLYSAAQLARQITSGVESLVATRSNIPERHRSLRVIFEHTWSRLGSGERTAFSEMTCFQESFTLEAAQAVTSASPASVTVLLDHALLQRLDSGRFTLHPVLRQFAGIYLTNAGIVAQQHATYYLTQIAAGPVETVAHIQADLDNVRAAWRWAVSQQATDLLAAALANLTGFYVFKGLYQEGYDMVALALVHVSGRPSLVNQMRLAQAVFCEKLGELERGIELARQVIETGDEGWIVPASITLGHLHEMRGEYEQAIATLKQALTLVRDGSTEMARIWSILGSVHRLRGDVEPCIFAQEQALRINQSLGEEMQAAENHAYLSLVYKDISAYADAIEHVQQALEIAQRLNHRENIARFTQNLGLLYWQQDDLDQAQACYQRALQIAEELNHKRGICKCAGGLGVLARRRYRFDEALRHYRRALKLAEELGDKAMQATLLGNKGNIHMEIGEYRRAAAYYQRAVDLDRAAGALADVARHLGNMGDTLKYQSRFAEALPFFEEAIPYLRQADALYYLCWVLVSYAECLFALGRLAEAQQANDEGGQLAATIGRALYASFSELLAARLLAARGDSDEAQARLRRLQETSTDAEIQAEILYALGEITGDTAHYQAAREAFARLYAERRIARYRSRQPRPRPAFSAGH